MKTPYTHLSPGDGTGFSKVPVQDAQTHQGNATKASGEVSKSNYETRMRPVRRK